MSSAARFPCFVCRSTVLMAMLLWSGSILADVGRADDAPSPNQASRETAISLRRDAPSRYQNFVVNWDADTDVLCAVVATPADYARLFHPAPVIGGKKPFAPPDDTFAKERLLVVARVVGGDGGSELSIERVVERGGDLEIHCRFKPSSATSSFSIKQAALAWIPTREPGPVTFIENGTKIAFLDASAGKWVSPSLPEAPAATQDDR